MSDDHALLEHLRRLFAPGRPEPDLGALAASLRGRVVEVPVPGGSVRVDLGDWTSLLLVWLGAWEPHLLELARSLVRPGDVAVDAGAHVGAWTLFLATLVGEQGRVLAWEPLPASAERALQAVRGAGLAGRVEVIEAALGERPGRALLYPWGGGARYPGADAMLRSLVRAPGYVIENAVEVSIDTLDAAGLERVDFVKIDTEGCELAVLRGARSLLARSPRANLLVELHAEELAALGVSVAEVFTELRAQGFSVLDLRPEGAQLSARPLAPGETPATHHVLARRDPTPFSVRLALRSP